MKTTRSAAHPRILTTTIALLLATHACAVTDTWDGGGADNNLSTNLNWLDNTAPLSELVNTDLIFAGAVRLTPNVSAVFSTNSVTFSNTAGAFIIGGTTLTIGAGGITNNDADTQTFTGATNFGLVTSSTINAASGGLTFTNIMTASNTLTVDGAFATSFSNISSGGLIIKQGAGTMTWAQSAATGTDLTVSAGTLTMTGATTFNSTSAIAVNGTSILNFNENTVLDGGLLTRAVSADVNVAAGKTLTVQNGGDFNVTGAFTRNVADTYVVTGAGSTFTTTSTLALSSGSVTNVLAGGSVSAGAGSISIGTSGNGTVTVDGAGSSLSGGTLNLGTAGANGSLAFSNGGTGAFGTINVGLTATSTIGTLLIQSGSSVTGTFFQMATTAVVNSGTTTINGAGSALTVSGAGATNIGAASLSTATLNVQSGGTFNSGTGTTTVNATGTINIAGGTFNANGNVTLNGTGAQLNRDATGVFTLTAGKLLTIQSGADAIFTGNYISAGENVTVTGGGSTFQMASGGALLINGGSTFAIQSGGSASSIGSLSVGFGTSGTLTVDGAGSSVSAAGADSIWANGSPGNVTFSNAATGSFTGLGVQIAFGSGTALVQVLTGADVSNSGRLTLGNTATVANGTLTVDGAGSTWTQTGSNTVALGVASGSTATLNVQNGGTFTTGTGTTTVNASAHVNITGGTFNANGSVTLNGTGAQLNRDAAGTFALALDKTLTVQAGADAAITGAFAQTTRANLTVTGSGSTFTTTGDFQWEGGTARSPSSP